MLEEQNQFIDGLGGELSPEDAAKLLDMAYGDTAEAETSDEPEAGHNEQGKQEATESDTDVVETEGENSNPKDPVIIAKDGVHTIPYEKLVAAREAEKAARHQAALAQQELEALRKQQSERHHDKDDDLDDWFDDAVDDDADDDGKDIAKIVEREIAKRLKPLEEQQQKNAAEAHYRAIYEAHPDADSVVESKELADWIKGQPSYAQAAIDKVLSQGTAREVVEVLSAFKATTSIQTAKPEIDKQTAKSQAKAVIENAKKAEPTTLSDIPTGRAAPASDAEAFESMSAEQIAEAMANWQPEKIERYLNSLR